MELIADLHIHTVACDHAFSTFQELAAAASHMGLAMIGISDHGPGCPDGPHRYYFRNAHRIPKTMDDGLEVRFGIEDDIMDEAGTLSLLPEDRVLLDYMMVGLHCHSEILHKGEAVRTRALMNAIRNNPVNIITHPAGTSLTVDLDEVLPLCTERNVCVELNASKVLRLIDDVKAFLDKTVKYGTRIVVNSDAHIAYEVGKTGVALDLLKELHYPEELVVNTSREKLAEYLGL